MESPPGLLRLIERRAPAEPAPPPIREPEPPENPDAPVREPEPTEPGEI